MWSDRKHHEDSPRTNPALGKPEALVRSAAADSQGIAVIGKGMMIKGQVWSAEHMYIAGEIEGSLHLAGYDLTVTAESRVHANVTAREVDISGSIQGNVDVCGSPIIRPGSSPVGSVS